MCEMNRSKLPVDTTKHKLPGIGIHLIYTLAGPPLTRLTISRYLVKKWGQGNNRRYFYFCLPTSRAATHPLFGIISLKATMPYTVLGKTSTQKNADRFNTLDGPAWPRCICCKPASINSTARLSTKALVLSERQRL